MIKMRVKSVCVGVGPLPSAVVLQPVDANQEDSMAPELTISTAQDSQVEASTTPNMLPISIGMADASGICAAAQDDCPTERPLTHKLLANTIQALGAKLVSVSINRVEGKIFFASLNIETPDGAMHHIDARPSDAITIALYEDIDIFADETVLERAGSPDYEAIERQERKRQESEFHTFVENLSPEDFIVHKDN